MVEPAADTIVVFDLDGHIPYANPTAARDAGPTLGEGAGTGVRRLVTADQPAAALRALLAALGRGESWRGKLVKRRPHGELVRVEATVAPIINEEGVVIGGVAVQWSGNDRDALETRLAAHLRERAALAAVLGAIRSGPTAEATAEAIARALIDLAGFGIVGLFSLEPDGEVAPLAALDAQGDPVALVRPLSLERSAYLRERASHGPWIEGWNPLADHPYAQIGRTHGVRVLAYVPVRNADDVIGLLVASAADNDALALTERLPSLVQCATVAGALLGPQLRSRSSRTVGQARIAAIIADGAFLPVFQPIVELEARAVVGYEALTRFADGSRPDLVFAEATRHGLTLELEAATLQAVVAAAGALPAGAWLNVNVSPEFVLAREPLASILGGLHQPIVLELTEHVAVSDYVALRAALERVRPGAKLAVDDAGAGFASLRHILELRPHYVKLDRGIIHEVDRDPARQALVACLVHFAAETGAIVIAEGVETEAEVRKVHALGVPLAQGYRLGRPFLASHVAGRILNDPPPAAGAPSQAVKRRQRTNPDDDIERAINIGVDLAAALRGIGILTVPDLRAIGALTAWERLRGRGQRIATGTTLLRLEGATRGIRLSQLAPAERGRLRLLTKLSSRPT